MHFYSFTLNNRTYYLSLNKKINNDESVIINKDNIYYLINNYMLINNIDEIDYKHFKRTIFIEDFIIVKTEKIKDYKIDESNSIYLPSYELINYERDEKIYITEEDYKKYNLKKYYLTIYKNSNSYYKFFIHDINFIYSNIKKVELVKLLDYNKVYEKSEIDFEPFGLKLIKSDLNEEEIIINNGISRIETNAFKDLDKIKKIIIETNNIIRIDNMAFNNLINLEEVYLKGPILIHHSAFYNCPNLKIIHSTYHNYYLRDEDLNIVLDFISDGEQVYDDFLIKDNTIITCIFRTKKNIVIPDYLKVGSLAFCNLKNLEYFRSNNKIVASYFIFHGCSNLTTLKLNNKLFELPLFFSDIYYENAYLLSNEYIKLFNVYIPVSLKNFNGSYNFELEDNIIKIIEIENKRPYIGDDIICLVSVCFNDYGREYYYLYDLDEEVKIDDKVIIEANGNELTVTVENVEYYHKNDSPYPYEKLKKVIKKI